MSLEFVLGALLIPLIFGAYVYTYGNARSIWAAIAELQKDLAGVKENEIKHLEDRVTRLEAQE